MDSACSGAHETRRDGSVGDRYGDGRDCMSIYTCCWGGGGLAVVYIGTRVLGVHILPARLVVSVSIHLGARELWVPRFTCGNFPWAKHWLSLK